MDQYVLIVDGKRVGVTYQEYLEVQVSVGIQSEPVDFQRAEITGIVVRNVQFDDLPIIEELPSFPQNSNPFRYDLYSMGHEVCGAWLAMYSGHAGLKQEHNKTEEEKQSINPVYYDDPEQITFVNQKTGQRFRIAFPSVIQRRAELIDRLSKESDEEAQHLMVDTPRF